MKIKKNKGFTLIELLIVVAIIAILAAIAIPNFLEAQTRSKVSRARTDMRTLSTALESYAVDYHHYPPVLNYNGIYVTPPSLTTPIAFLTSVLYDPFGTHMPDEPSRRYNYNNVKQLVENNTPSWPPNDLLRYGDWRFVSLGPKKELTPWMPYDSTNGTISSGSIIRTQRSPEGRVMFTFWDPANPNV